VRSVLFISPHFPPDSAAGTHRARILAPHLSRFGWNPMVLTVDPSSIDGEQDVELGNAVVRDVEVIRVGAWARAWTRRAGFGDLGLRAYRALRAAACTLTTRRKVDAVLVTTYPTYPALIGKSLKKTLAMPFVLDLQDPWVSAWGKSVGPGGRPDLRSRASRIVAAKLEASVVPAADALMSVTARTMTDVVARVPSAAALPQLEVPIGWEPRDWAAIRGDGRGNGFFNPHDGCLHVCAVGTLLPTALAGLQAFLEAVAQIASPVSATPLRIWFIGTSNQRQDDAPAMVRPLLASRSLNGIVHEHPPRVTYFDALRVLRDAHAVLVLGSDEPHYTPSRVFPALASRRPIIARLHPQSPANQLLTRASTSRHVQLIDSSSELQQQTLAFSRALMELSRPSLNASAQDDGILAPFTGEALAGEVARLLNRVCH
jgi:hypothetical protein